MDPKKDVSLVGKWDSNQVVQMASKQDAQMDEQRESGQVGDWADLMDMKMGH